MGSWGSGNFDSDGAANYLVTVINRLRAEVDEVLTDADRSSVDEDGEAVVVPTVQIISVLVEHCQAAPPEPAVVSVWRDKYLAIYDAQIDGMDPVPGYKEERRQVIVETFAKLEKQACAFWKDLNADR